MKNQNKKGFTLTELLIVIAIIGILVSTATLAFVSSNKKARDAVRISELRQIQTALSIYAINNNDKYPASLGALSNTLPKDPVTGENYFYCSNGASSNNGNSYHLGAALEINPSDFLDNDADITIDGCVSGSFNGKNSDCIGTGSCQGAKCEGCYDLSQNFFIGSGGGTGGDDNGGGEGGGNNGGGNRDEPKPETPTSFSVATPASYRAVVSWNPPADTSKISEYRIHTYGYLFNGYGFENKEIVESSTSNSIQVTGLYPNHQYNFFIESIDKNGKASLPSQTITVTMIPRCPDGSCDDGEYCFTCENDCGRCPRPIEFYKNDPYFKQFFSKP